MKTNSTQNKDLIAKLAGYAASAGALIALAPAVNGQIVYSGEKDLEFSASEDPNLIDLDGDGIDDFGLLHNSIANTSVGTATTVYMTIAAALVANVRTDTYNSFLAGYSTGASIALADALASDEVISSGQNPWYHSGQQGILDFVYYVRAVNSLITVTTSMGIGQFGGETGFLGVRFVIDGQQHYGWMRISIPEDWTPVTLHDWAYNTIPGEGLTTGFVTPSFDHDEIYHGLSATIEINFDEPISDLSIDDFVIDGGSITSLGVITTGESYELDIQADEEGVVNISLPSGSVVSDKAVLEAETMVAFITSVDLENVTESDIEVFPNPATDLLNINLEHPADVSIRNLSGQIIKEYQGLDNNAIDISELNSGIYHLEISSKGNIIAVRKFIKK